LAGGWTGYTGYLQSRAPGPTEAREACRSGDDRLQLVEALPVGLEHAHEALERIAGFVLRMIDGLQTSRRRAAIYWPRLMLNHQFLQQCAATPGQHRRQLPRGGSAMYAPSITAVADLLAAGRRVLGEVLTDRDALPAELRGRGSTNGKGPVS
jgi:hypothetical protein